MNSLEQRMVENLKELKEKHGAISVKAEFEAEGTKIEELLRIKEVCMRSGVDLTLKIGGCESIRDMLEARTVGVNNLVAPMVESPYALQKYLQAVKKVFTAEERKNIEILCNIETITAGEKLEEMINIPEINELKGIVIERVDLSYSMGLSAESVNDDKVNNFIVNASKIAKKKNLVCVIGGGVSAQSIPFFTKINNSIDRFETRKICFDLKKSLNSNPEKGILKALRFELLWLKNKLGFYKNISIKDKERMSLIENRYWNEIDLYV